MADKKISALTASTTPLAGTEVLPIVQGGSTVKVSVANLTAGRAVTALSATTTAGLRNTSAGSDTESTTQGLFLTDAATKNVIVQLGASGGLSTFIFESGGAGWRRVSGLLTNGNSVVDVGNVVIGTTAKGMTTGSSIPLGFGVNNSVTAMTIDTSSNLIVGGTSQLLGANASRLEVQAPVDKHGTTSVVESVGFVPFIAWNRAASGDNNFAAFGTEASYTGRGGISYNRAAGLVVYATTSDYRAKKIVGPVENSGATIDSLKIYMGKMHGATETRPMLIAHEAQEVAPYAVTGTKDAVNEDGSPEYQQIDVSTLVPLLIAEVQSLRARVAQLEGK